MTSIGIDPGLQGGIALITPTGASARITPTIGGKEFDIQAMRLILTVLTGELHATIENQIALPGQGLSSTLQTGKGFGIWLGLLAGLGIPYRVVAARAWQQKLFTGVKGTLDTKEKSETVAKRLFPQVDFRRSERATKAHDGLTDAILIAEYGRIISTSAREAITGVPHEGRPETPEVCRRCGVFIPVSNPNDCIAMS